MSRMKTRQATEVLPLTKSDDVMRGINIMGHFTKKSGSRLDNSTKFQLI